MFFFKLFDPDVELVDVYNVFFFVSFIHNIYCLIHLAGSLV